MNIEQEIDQAFDNDEVNKALWFSLGWVDDEPENHKAWSKLSFMQEMTNDLPGAIESVNMALTLEQDHPPHLFKLALLEFKSKHFEASIAAFDRCKKKSEDLQDGYFIHLSAVSMAKCYLLLNQPKKALDLLQDLPDEAGMWLDEQYVAIDLKKEALTALAH